MNQERKVLFHGIKRSMFSGIPEDSEEGAAVLMLNLAFRCIVICRIVT